MHTGADLKVDNLRVEVVLVLEREIRNVVDTQPRRVHACCEDVLAIGRELDLVAR